GLLRARRYNRGSSNRRRYGRAGFACAFVGGDHSQNALAWDSRRIWSVGLRRRRSLQASWIERREDGRSSVGSGQKVIAKSYASTSLLTALFSPDFVSFLISTFELRPLTSYFSRLAAGKSSGVPSINPPLDWK